MLIASLLLLALDRLAGLPGPYSGARFADLLPGLVLVSPSFIHAAIGAELRSIDGVFWTLYVEAAFYVFFGTLYFVLGWKRAVIGLVASFVLLRLAGWGLPAVHAPHLILRAIEPFEWAGLQHFGWFASGALFYKAHTSGNPKLATAAILVGLLSVALYQAPVGVSIGERVMLTLVVLGFAAAGVWHPLQACLSFTPLMFVGFISYPLYLVHSNLGLGLITFFAKLTPSWPSELAVIPTIVIVITLAWLIAKYIEPWLRGILTRLPAAFKRPAIAGRSGSQRS
jgi:peptidoglycan/LPS O-acetylase OafA/YrhL